MDPLSVRRCWKFVTAASFSPTKFNLVWEEPAAVRILTAAGFSENPVVVIFLDRRRILREFVFFRGGPRSLREIGDAESYSRRILWESGSPSRPDETEQLWGVSISRTRFAGSHCRDLDHTSRLNERISNFSMWKYWRCKVAFEQDLLTSIITCRLVLFSGVKNIGMSLFFRTLLESIKLYYENKTWTSKS
jgi:hypothetical protein